MNTEEKNRLFNEDSSANYDRQWAKLSAMNKALYLFTHVLLSGLPDDAHILCVGAGTGEEMVSLARHYPGWRFTAVDPSMHMLKVCERKVRKLRIEGRCTFHPGYLGSLSAPDQFDAATCFLVSHYWPTP